MGKKFTDHELFELEKEMKSSLSSYMVQTPSSKDTRSLIEKLQPNMDELSRHAVKRERASHPSLLKQCLNQMRQFNVSFWLISVVIFVMITLVTQGNMFGSQYYNGTFSYMPPIYLLLALMYTFKAWNKEMRMIETVTPFPPALLLLTRMIDVLLIFIIFSLISTIYLNIISIGPGRYSPFLFILSWLAPTMLIFSLSAYMMLWKGVKFGFIITFGLWLLYLFIPDGLINLNLGVLIPFFQIMVICLGCLLLTFTTVKSRKLVQFYTS